MQKLLNYFLAFSLAGCVSFTSIDSKVYDGNPPVPKEKIGVNCSGCYNANREKYFDYDSKSNYEIKITRNSKYRDDSNVLLGVLGILSLGIIPSYWGADDSTYSGELINKETNQAISLGTIKASADFWGGWLMLPLMPFMPDWDDESDTGEARELLLKKAALILYDPTNSNITEYWHCAGYSCRYKEIIAQKTVSAQDALYVAENTKSFDEFQKVKNKLAKPLTTTENCDATISLIKNEVISKSTARYWSLIDFYKANCSKVRSGVGMDKERLIETRGIPTKGYKMNADTEIITYSTLSRNGEQVVSTTYTLDRDIVTKIK